MTRRNWTTASLAFGAGALVAAVVLVTPGADATDGQPILAGESNNATHFTQLHNNGGDAGLSVFSGGIGVSGVATSPSGFGVIGQGDGTGVDGETTADGGTGVFGTADFPTGIGVHGKTSGSGSGVFGEATGAGAGVNGLSDSGVGVEAQSSNGTALKVVGKATFSRSGVVTIPAGASLRTVQLARVTPASMVLATAQQAAAVFVKSAVPAAGTFTIRLTAKAPAGGLKVAYFVLN